MKTLILSLAVIALGAFATTASRAQEAPRDGVVIHISHGPEDPHRLLMALNMAVMMAGDHDVLVYFDIQAVNAVLKDSPDVTFSHFPSSRTQIRALLEKKVILMACPGCLKAAGKTKADLADGIQVADREKLFSFTKGRILALDY